MTLYSSFKNGDYSEVFQAFNMRSWGEDDDDDFVFPLHQLIPPWTGKSKDPFTAKNSFSSVDEYSATIGLGAKVIQTINELEEGFEFKTVLRVLKQEDGGLVAIVEIPEKTRKKMAKCRSDPLSPGARGFVCLRYSAKGVDTAQSEPTNVVVRLSMEFIEPFPASPPGFLTAKLQARQKRERRSEFDFSLGKDEDEPDLERITVMESKPRRLLSSLESQESMAFVLNTIPHVVVPCNLSGTESMTYILEQAGTPGYVDTVIRHSEFCYVFEAWTCLCRQRRSLKFLSAPAPPVPRVDIYDGLADKTLVDSYCLQLNPSQRVALQLGRSAPAGFVIANGGPGTGKTHFIIQAVKPFFLDAKSHRLLLTSAGNRGVDSIAHQLNEWLQSLDESARGESYIVRLHSIKTETTIFLRDAEVAKRKALVERARKAAQKSQQQTTPKMPNRAIADHYQTYGSGKLNEVGDDRVQNMSLAVGTKMKQNMSQYPDLQALYEDYAGGKITLREKLKEFHRRVRVHLIETLSKAMAVCATVAGVGDDAVKMSFGFYNAVGKVNYPKCDLIVVDEAARVAEYQWWPLLGFYDNSTNFIGKIMVGDFKQMGPASSKEEERSPFEAQMGLSLQERLQNRGLPSRSFDVQYRAVPEVATIYNNACYGGLLKSDERTYVEARPLARAIVEHNEIAYGREHSIVFFDVAGAEEEVQITKIYDKRPNGRPGRRSGDDPTEIRRPKWCNEYIFTITSILEGLINAGIGGGQHPASIAVLTPYKLEYNRLRHLKTKMTRVYPQAADIIVETVDKVQGREYDVVIVDPVMVSKPGFLDLRRLNVMFSRARCGLYVVGCMDKWKRLFYRIADRGGYDCPLECFAKQLYPYSVRYPMAEDEDCPESNEFYDPKEFEKVSGRQKK
ncbi:hypothetical protein PG994_012702 [Apiospora phragmitis]|uniref:Uncharacterized protein n=1 Tax=Apiospora phragmitis TaxID=2905665 RepID=A0ABR1TDL1_9PEZI